MNKDIENTYLEEIVLAPKMNDIIGFRNLLGLKSMRVNGINNHFTSINGERKTIWFFPVQKEFVMKPS